MHMVQVLLFCTVLYSCFSAALPGRDDVTSAQELVNALQVLEIVGPVTHSDLLPEVGVVSQDCFFK